MDLRTFLGRSPAFSDHTQLLEFASYWSPVFVRKGAALVPQGEPDTKEYIILDGSAVSRIYDATGRAACVGLSAAGILTPNIARTRNGLSLVSIEAITDATVVQMDSATLTELMIESEPIRDWANGVLREELSRKADKEWCLAALGGAERLSWFRDRYPGYEDIFTHSLIASFLGVTPVTFSRLRAKSGNQD